MGFVIVDPNERGKGYGKAMLRLGLQYAFEIPEEKLLFCGDEPLKEEFLSKADGVKYLLHEAFCLYEERGIFHSESASSGNIHSTMYFCKFL